MASVVSLEWVALLVGTALMGFGLWTWARSSLRKSLEKQQKEDDDQHVKDDQNHASNKPAPLSKRQKARLAGSVAKEIPFQHAWLLTSLKGHSGQVLDLDISDNGKYIASCADDRTVLLWAAKELKPKEHKPLRANVQYDYGTKITWSPDNKAYVIVKAKENVLEVYKISRKEDGSSALGHVSVALTFSGQHADKIIALGFASTGRYLMSCSEKTALYIWDLKGDLLQTIDTYHMTTHCAKVSPCGRFVASSGFTPDVKVWEVRFKRTGDFDGVHRAFELTGHPSGVFSFDFSQDSSRMVTLCKDAHWRLYDTRKVIDFGHGQDPGLLVTGDAPNVDESSIIALSPNAMVVVIACGTTITWFDALKGTQLAAIDKIHHSCIKSLRFDKEGNVLFTSGDKHIRVFHNIPEFKLRISELRSKLSTASSEGMKERLRAQIVDLEAKTKC